jgi:hypothetical protein
VFVERDPIAEKGEDHFIREGVTIAGVSSIRQPGIRVIVSIKDKALSKFLGDSENPAHTEWQERSPKFKNKYNYGPTCLRFVKNSPREIIKILTRPAKGRDENLLKDFFYIDIPPEPEQPGSKEEPKDKPGGDHPGYWWLAFDLENYRYSCTFCNSLRKSEADEPAGGKADHFPIVDEDRRAYEPNNPIQDELPFILDPRSQGDPLLLTFEDDGRAIPRYGNDDSSLHCKRASISIKIYHLNHPDVKEARFTVCNEIHELVKEGDRAFLRQSENLHAALVGRESFDGIVRRIRLMVDRDAEYSRAARAVLSSYRSKPWVESILEDLN